MTDFADIRGQSPAIESLITAIAAGERRILLVGAPGLGLEMIARRVSTLFPPLTAHERVWLEAERDGMPDAYDSAAAISERPFVVPHHSIRHESLLGGWGQAEFTWDLCSDMPEIRTICGCRRALPSHAFHRLPESPVARAGWLHRARFGVLLLHRIDEFSADLVRSLAHDLDRMTGAPFVLVGAAPCACGWLGSSVQECLCGELSRQLYTQSVQKRIAILGITSKVEIPYVSLRDMRGLPPGESSESLRARIETMRAGRTAEGSEP